MEKKDNKERFKWSIGESILLILIAIVASLNSWRYLNIDKVDDLYDESIRTAEVLDRYMTGAGYKVSPEFILILRDVKSGLIFDLYVTPSTYYQGVTGNKMSFKLSKYDIGYRGDSFMTKLCNAQYALMSILLILMLSVFSLAPTIGDSHTVKCLSYILITNMLNVILLILTII